MYLLDTNVISEIRKVWEGRAHQSVSLWFNEQDITDCYFSPIVTMELEVGVQLLERRDTHQGRRLRYWLESKVLPEFAQRTLHIDNSIAQCCAAFHVPDPKPDRDAFIAATAIVHNLVVVTRNTSDFEGTGAATLNPWHY